MSIAPAFGHRARSGSGSGGGGGRKAREAKFDELGAETNEELALLSLEEKQQLHGRREVSFAGAAGSAGGLVDEKQQSDRQPQKKAPRLSGFPASYGQQAGAGAGAGGGGAASPRTPHAPPHASLATAASAAHSSADRGPDQWGSPLLLRRARQVGARGSTAARTRMVLLSRAGTG
jgi:hypothetical protein